MEQSEVLADLAALSTAVRILIATHPDPKRAFKSWEQMRPEVMDSVLNALPPGPQRDRRAAIHATSLAYWTEEFRDAAARS